MENLNGLRQVKQSIRIHAPVEICYQTWTDYSHFPAFMSRVIDFQNQTEAPVITSNEEIHPKALLLTQGIVPAELVNHWLFAGPGGKLYEVKNRTSLEIPNHFYCMTSTDPDDTSIRTSLLFSPDMHNQNTLLELECSFWSSNTLKKGKSTQLATDILEADDSFWLDCLQDFKKYVEEKLRVSTQTFE
jgi:hypothetical protein